MNQIADEPNIIRNKCHSSQNSLQPCPIPSKKFVVDLRLPYNEIWPLIGRMTYAIWTMWDSRDFGGVLYETGTVYHLVIMGFSCFFV